MTLKAKQRQASPGLAFATFGFYVGPMIKLRRLAVLSAVLAVTAVLAGCAGSDTFSLSQPGKYNVYNCVLLNENGIALVRRERELEDLIRKAEQGAGGKIASALAYRNEYNITQGDLREIERVGAEKKCVMKHRLVPEQQPQVR